MLTLPIKRKWFDMIVNGEKKEEYRDIKPYYDSRLLTMFGCIIVNGKLLQNIMPEIAREPEQKIMFRNGYSKNSPSCIALCRLQMGKGRPEWGANPDKDYYILKILEVKEVINEKL